jgi:hypothetical protein
VGKYSVNIEELKRLREEGKTGREIAGTMCCPEWYIERLVRKSKLPKLTQCEWSLKRRSTIDHQQVIDFYVSKKKGLDYISKSIGISVHQVTAILKDNGVSIRGRHEVPNQRTSENKKLVPKLYESGVSQEEISRRLGTSKEYVKGFLVDSGVDLRSPSERCRDYPLDDNAFDKISEHSAYFIGLMMADGWIIENSPTSYTIGLGLKTEDRSMIEEFGRFVKTSHPIYDYISESPGWKKTECYHSRIVFNSEHMAKTLIGFGVVPNKTHIAEVKGLEYDSRFWRGVCDGDGSVVCIDRDSGYWYPVLAMLGSESLMTQFAEYCNKITGHRPSIHKRKGCFHVALSHKKAKEVICEMYNNSSIAIDRKKRNADRIYHWKPAKIHNQPCGVQGCGMTTKARGLCGFHYERMVRGRVDPKSITDLVASLWKDKIVPEYTPVKEKTRKTCAVPGCDKLSQARGVCRAHWYSIKHKKLAVPEAVIGLWDNTKDTMKICPITGCEKYAMSKGLCGKHYHLVNRGRIDLDLVPIEILERHWIDPDDREYFESLKTDLD